MGQVWQGRKDASEPRDQGATSGGLWMRRSPPTSENGKFLAQTVGVPLTKALAEAVIRRPADPIGFISEYLYDYYKETQVTRLESDSVILTFF